MIRKVFLCLLVVAGFYGLCAPASAQAPGDPAAGAELRMRGEQVMAMLRGEGDPADMFTAEFLAQVPIAQLRGISEQLNGQYGAPRTLRIEARGPTSGILHIETERGMLTMNIALEPQAPNKISGLLVTNAQLSGDSLGAVVEEIKALPGQAALAVANLDDSGVTSLAAHQADRPMAIGSAFKLFILAELSRQVQAGERRWSDVVTIDSKSLPSGVLQNWPARSPMTLHSLASLMISISDNTATDNLLRVLGRENVERMMGRMGLQSAERNRPFLATAEVFALKSASAAEQSAFIAANEAERRRLLQSRYSAMDTSRIDPALFGAAPLQIEAIEWFASPADLVRTMDWMRRNGDQTARDILAISPGGPAALNQEFSYIGFKGGSEPGVINLTWLVRNRAGAWHAVTGSWNNPNAAVDETRFATLMQRLVRLVG